MKNHILPPPYHHPVIEEKLNAKELAKMQIAAIMYKTFHFLLFFLFKFVSLAEGVVRDVIITQVNCVSTSSQGNADTTPATAAVTDGYGAGQGRLDFVDSLSTMAEKSLKKRRIGTDRAGIPGSRSWAVVESVKRLHEQETRSSAAIAELRRLSEHPSAVDLDSSESS